MIQYKEINYSATEPTNPELGDIWIKNVGDSYQVYSLINNTWVLIMSGGTYISETNPDNHYFNIYVQESEPASPKLGFFWIKPSLNQMYIYLNQFIPFVGA